VGPLSIINEVTSQKSFWKFLFAILLLMGVRIVYRHLDATFPKYMMREFGKDVMYGSIIAINPFLIVILIPVFAPLSYQFSAYSQITFGAFITSLSPFFLATEPHLWSAIMFVVILSIGEALWSPRLYEYTIFITEKGREGIYMALASSPMFIATLVTGATSGKFLETFCPEKGIRESWKMWLMIGIITLTSPVLLYLLRSKIEVTEDELIVERTEKERKRIEKETQEKLEQEKNKNASLIGKYDKKILKISNDIEIDIKIYKIHKQGEFSL
jgi:MFS family permease